MRANVVSRWPSKLGGSSGTTNLRMPPFLGASASDVATHVDTASSIAAGNANADLQLQTRIIGLLPWAGLLTDRLGAASANSRMITNAACAPHSKSPAHTVKLSLGARLQPISGVRGCAAELERG